MGCMFYLRVNDKVINIFNYILYVCLYVKGIITIVLCNLIDYSHSIFFYLSCSLNLYLSWLYLNSIICFTFLLFFINLNILFVFLCCLNGEINSVLSNKNTHLVLLYSLSHHHNSRTLFQFRKCLKYQVLTFHHCMLVYIVA